MKEYDYEEFEKPKQKTFASEEQKAFWEAFSKGAQEGETRTFFTGNIQTISAYMSYEREREKQDTRER